MVNFSNISIEEAHGKLVFVIKLDEMELINSEKYERVSITLMNRAMDPKIEVTDKKYFFVNEYGGEIPQFNYHASGIQKINIVRDKVSLLSLNIFNINYIQSFFW